MFAALKRLFGTKGPIAANEEASKGVAKSRLHFVLVQDRTGLTTEEMAEFKQELINVINRFFDIHSDALDVSYKRDTGMTTLLINSPVLVRRRPGVDEAPTKNKERPIKPVTVNLTTAVTKEVSSATDAGSPIQRAKKSVGDDVDTEALAAEITSTKVTDGKIVD